MQLTKSQKKYIKKNIRSLPISEIANNLKIPESEIRVHLKEYWGEEKYQKFIQKEVTKSPVITSPSNFPSDSKTFFKQNWKYLLLLFILVAATFSNSVGNDFLSDDIAAIKDNQNIGKIYSFIFSTPPFFSLQRLTHFIIFSLFGKIPAIFRSVNIFSHLISTVTIFILLSTFFEFPINLFSALFFAVHPLLAEGIIWISAMPYSMGGLFAFLCLLFYIISQNYPKDKKNFFYRLSIVSFLITVITIEKYTSLFLILIVWEFFINKKTDFIKKIKNLVPFFLISLVWTLVLLGPINQRANDLKTVHYQQSTQENLLLKVPVAIGSYLSLAFWPGKSISFYHSELNFSKTEFCFLILLLITYMAGTIYFFFKNKRVFFWLSFFSLSLIPTLAPFGLGWVVAERYVYFGAIGIFVFVSWGIYNLCRLVKKPDLSYVIMGITVICLSARTIIRNRDFRNQDYLWLATAKTSPSSPQNHNNLGDLYARRKEYNKAIEEFNTAIALKPNYGDAYHNVANVYVLSNQTDKAIEHYNKAIQFNPNLWQSHQNLGSVYFSLGKLDLAEQEFRKAVQINPMESSLHSAVGLILLNTNKKEGAISELKTALELNPQNAQAQQWLQQAVNSAGQPPK